MNHFHERDGCDECVVWKQTLNRKANHHPLLALHLQHAEEQRADQEAQEERETTWISMFWEQIVCGCHTCHEYFVFASFQTHHFPPSFRTFEYSWIMSYLENPPCCLIGLFIFILEDLLCLTVICMVAVSPEVEQKLPPHWARNRLLPNPTSGWPFLAQHYFYLMVKQNQTPDIGLKDNNIEMARPCPDGQMPGPLAACSFFLQPPQFWRQTGLSALRYLQCLIPSALCQLSD